MPGWALVAVVAATTALGSFLPGSGLLSPAGHPHPQVPRAVGPVSGPARPAAEAASRVQVGAQPRAVVGARAGTATPRRPRAQHHPHAGQHKHRKAHRHPHQKHHHGKQPTVHARAHPGPRGADVSWPQCGDGLPMPPHATDFVVVGLTNGPAFEENPCVARQVRWARQHHLHTGAYAVASYPDRHELRRHGGRGPWSHRTLVGRLRNVGFQEARRAVATLHRVGLHPPLVWVDVEPAVRRPWSSQRRLNAAVVHGLVHGYRHTGHRVGFYSTAHLWRQILGPVRYRAPEWRTAGPSSPHDALARCRQPRSSIQGGRPVIAQWWTTRHDHDALCPGSRHPDRLRLFFHKF